MIFPYIPDETEELIASTCEGSYQYFDFLVCLLQLSIGIGGGDQILLHWAGDGKNAVRRRQSGCDGYCESEYQISLMFDTHLRYLASDLGETYNTAYRDRNECDEFPPGNFLPDQSATSKPAHSSCSIESGRRRT